MKVLLINPPSNSPQPIMPLGLAYLAAALESKGIPVDVVDAWAEGLDFKLLEKRIAETEGVGLIGITVMSPIYPAGIKTIRIARKAAPESKIIIGGTHPSSLPEECLKDCPELDFAAAGEGDELIVRLVGALLGDGTQLSSIKGLAYRENGVIIFNGHADPISDLDDLPFPSRHLFPLPRYKPHPPYRLYNAFATMITSRGCPFQCTYCTKSVSGRDFRFQSTGRVVDEIDHLIKNYGIRQIHFYDDDFTINKKRVADLCDEIVDRKIKIVWSCVTRVDLVDEILLEKMKMSGCWLISYGVESGCQHILDKVKKGYKVEQVKNAFMLTKMVGIRTLGYFMAGFPGETRETLNDTVELSFEIDPDFVSWSITALYPGSNLYDQAVAGELGNNYVRVRTPVEEHNSNVSSLSPYAHGHTFIYEGELSRDYILDTVNKAYRRFYFRPAFLFRFLMRLKTFTEAFSYVKALCQYLTWRKGR